jgi:hypothetical protein
LTQRGKEETCETSPFCSNKLARLIEGSYLTKGGEESESQEVSVSINKASQQTKHSAKLANTMIQTYCEYLLDTIKILCNFIEKFCKKSMLNTQSINLTQLESYIMCL